MTFPKDLRRIIHVLIEGRWYPAEWGSFRFLDDTTARWREPEYKDPDPPEYIVDRNAIHGVQVCRSESNE
jgi:hypothetical protein